MEEYGVHSYWNRRYTSDKGLYDWYMEWPDIVEALKMSLDTNSSILHVGCGNSKLAKQLQEAGFNNVKHTDFSTIGMQQMKRKFPDLDFEVLDASKVGDRFQPESYDIVLDKGCLDSVLCSNKFHETVPSMMSGIHKVLRNNGIYIIVSVGGPKIRLMHLESDNLWKVRTIKVKRKAHQLLYEQVEKEQTAEFENSQVPEYLRDDNNDNRYHYIYVCTKNHPAE